MDRHRDLRRRPLRFVVGPQMRKDTFGFAVVGTGAIVDRFLDALSHVEGARAVALYSRKEETGNAFAARHGGLTVYTDYDRMLEDPAVHGVYIATPHFCHKEQTLRALRAGRHVLVEKSAALTAADFREMREEAGRTGRVLLEAMRPDFDPAYDIVRKTLPSLGRIRRISLVFCQYSSRYDAFRRGEVKNAFDPSIGNSALLDIGVYPLHLCLSLFGMPEETNARAVFLDNGFEAAGDLALSYQSRGFLATVSYSKVHNAMEASVIEGEDGALRIDKLTEPKEIRYISRGKEPVTLPFAAEENNMRFEIEAFLEMTEGKRSPTPYLDLTEATLTLMDKASKAPR